MLKRNWIEKQWEKLADCEEEQWMELLEKMGDQQPFLLTFLTEIGEDDLNESEAELLLFMGVFVWYLTEHNRAHVEAVSEAALLQSRDQNESLWEFFTRQTISDPEEVLTLAVSGHAEVELLNFLAEVLWDDEEIDVDIRQEQLVVVWLYLKIVIDTLHPTPQISK